MSTASWKKNLRKPYPRVMQFWTRIDKRWATSREFRIVEVNEEENYVEVEPLDGSYKQRGSTRVKLNLFRSKYDFELKVDDARRNKYDDSSGLYVRALGTDGRWGTFDMAQLDRTSFLAFLQREQELTPWMRSIMFGLFNYPREEEKDG
jgi:hypothetical protein